MAYAKLLSLATVTWISLTVWAEPGIAQTTPSRFMSVEGKHIRLRTDVATREEAQDYVNAFDTATDQWQHFFDLTESKLQSWSVDAIIMSDRATATREGLIEPRTPDFRFGYANGNQIYVIAQPSPYYTRHLLLHEGVHALAYHVFGGAGPPWFMEGTAEILSTHRGAGSETRVNQIPLTREASPYWGRLKIIRETHATGSIPSLESIMRAPPRLDGDVTTYSWSWAAVMLLAEYPEYRDLYNKLALAGHDSSSELTRQLYERLLPQWPALVARFRIMALSLDYGYDWSRERVSLSVADPIWDGRPISLSVAADQGWQSAGHVFPAGARIEIHASGQTTLAQSPKPWRSEPAGVTIRYHDGRPLGQLIATLIPTRYDAKQPLPALRVQPVGEATVMKVAEPSWIVFRINDAAGELVDNEGAYSIELANATGG